MKKNDSRSGGLGGARRGGSPKPVGDAIESFLRRRGLLQGIEDRRLFLDWAGLVGPGIGRETRPLKVERGILWIGVNNAPQANHLLYLKAKLLGRIKERYPESRIRDLRVLHHPSQGRPRR